MNPVDATNKTIVWSVNSADTTGVVTGDLATGKFTPAAAGTLVLTATITNGATASTDYTQVVTIMVAPSSDATLKATSTIKGAAIGNLGTPNANMDSVLSGSVTITTVQANDITNVEPYITLFDPTNAGATVTKVVQYFTGDSTTYFETTDPDYANEAIIDGDFFIIKVTAADSSVLYYRIIVTVTP